MAEGLDSTQFETQMAQFGFTRQNIVFEVADFLFEVEDAGGG